MRKTFGMNQRQKRVYKNGEAHVGREQVAELLEMTESDDPEERLEAAQYLCPCHVRTRIAEVWEAIYRLMEDADPRVRQQAWHTIEDGGKPGEEAVAERLIGLCRKEAAPKVRQFAEFTLDKTLGRWRERDMAALWAAGRPAVRQRGKCDFCGESEVFVEWDFDTMIPVGDLPRAARICDRCAKRK